MEYIPIDKELEAFDSHLERNERTIFSAKFGDGKTYFLKKFTEKYETKYKFITIYPVNYQIADNKEIFEYIKRDILIQMIRDGMIQPSFEIPEYLKLQFYIAQHGATLLTNLIENLPILGIPDANKFIAMFSSLTSLKKIKDSYSKYREAIDNNDDEKLTEIYTTNFSEIKGCPYEIDLITHIIIKNIEYYKEKENKKIVLLIEDLDRLDPEHLFRILNVFSAHIDRVYQLSADIKSTASEKSPELLPNKFGFDKVVTVFDYNTTKSIFHHFYGKEANYQGYINKFISMNPFNYSIKKVAQNFLIDFIKNKCLISLSELKEELYIPSIGGLFIFYNKINDLSIREIKNILTDIEKDFTEDSTMNIKGTIVSTRQPICYLLILLKRMNIQFQDDDLWSLLAEKNQVINIINAFLFLKAPNLLFKDYFKYRENIYKIVESQKSSTNYKFFTFIPTSIPYGNMSNIEDLDRVIKSGINYAREYIR